MGSALYKARILVLLLYIAKAETGKKEPKRGMLAAKFAPIGAHSIPERTRKVAPGNCDAS